MHSFLIATLFLLHLGQNDNVALVCVHEIALTAVLLCRQAALRFGPRGASISSRHLRPFSLNQISDSHHIARSARPKSLTTPQRHPPQPSDIPHSSPWPDI